MSSHTLAQLCGKSRGNATVSHKYYLDSIINPFINPRSIWYLRLREPDTLICIARSRTATPDEMSRQEKNVGGKKDSFCSCRQSLRGQCRYSLIVGNTNPNDN